MIPSTLRLSFLRICPPRTLAASNLSLRQLSGSSLVRQKEPANSPATTQSEPAKPPPADAQKPQLSMSNAYKPDDFEKRILVWTKKYKSVEDVPSHVSREEMEKSRSKMRIRISNYMIAATLIGCIIMVYSGKKAAERGDSVAKTNMEWHADLKEQKRKEDEAALAKSYNTK